MINAFNHINNAPSVEGGSWFNQIKGRVFFIYPYLEWITAQSQGAYRKSNFVDIGVRGGNYE